MEKINHLMLNLEKEIWRNRWVAIKFMQEWAYIKQNEAVTLINKLDLKKIKVSRYQATLFIEEL